MEKVNIPTSWGPINLSLENERVVGCTLPFLKNTPRKSFAITGLSLPSVTASHSRGLSRCARVQGLESNCVALRRFATQVQSFFQGLDLMYSERAFGIPRKKRSNRTRQKSASPDAVRPGIGKLEGTDFQKAVWKELQKIPRGQTRTYGEIAKAIGRPNAVRAVGAACGANPVPLFIPCHRVVAQNGLGGFGAGLPWKKLLLELEGCLRPRGAYAPAGNRGTIE